ncbi:MAG: hypothetical protein JNJ85_16910 [Candidatus Kapabacteria bacterium]|nr:hypothetical protein [Candidatus Kapabacteria bacterium]
MYHSVRDCLYAADYNKANELAATLYKTSLQENNSRYVGRALNQLGLLHFLTGEFVTSYNYYLQALPYIECDEPDIQIYFYWNVPQCARQVSEFENCLIWSFRALELATQYNKQDAIGAAYYNLFSTYTRISQYEQALHYSNKMIALGEARQDVRTLGAAWQGHATTLFYLHEYERALESFQKALNYFLHPDNSRWKTRHASTCLTNIASTQHHLGRQNEALDTINDYFKLIKGNEHDVDGCSLANTLNIKALCLRETGEYTKAITAANKALSEYKKHPDEQGMTSVHVTLASLHVLTNNPKALQTLNTGHTLAFKEKSGEFRPRILAQFALYYTKIDNFQKALEYRVLEHEEQKKHWENAQNQRAQYAHIAYNIEQLQREREHATQKAAHLEELTSVQNKQLATLTLQLNEKNKVLSTIQERIEYIKHSGNNKATISTLDELTNEVKTNQFNENYWTNFQEHFERINPDFNRKLLELCPKLTPSELRVCSLLLLQLTNKEIADIMKLSTRTVDNHRNHIRVKLKLPAQSNLVSFLSGL